MEIGRFSQRSLFYFTLFGAAILMINALMVYPDYRKLKALDREIEQLEGKIEIQRLLYPLFQEILGELELKLPEGVVVPQEAKLTLEQTEKIVSIFRKLAFDSGLKVVEVSPDIDSTLGGSGFMLVDVALKGDFTAIREFLLTLGTLPYLDRVERLKLQDAEGGLEARLRAWLLMEAKAAKRGPRI